MKSQQELREIERSELGIVRILYIEAHNSRQIERCREVLRFKGSIDTAIKQLSRGVHNKNRLDGSRSYQGAIERSETFSAGRRAIEKLSRLR